MSGRQSGVGADRRRHEKDEYDGFGLSDLRAAESSHQERLRGQTKVQAVCA